MSLCGAALIRPRSAEVHRDTSRSWSWEQSMTPVARFTQPLLWKSGGVTVGVVALESSWWGNAETGIYRSPMGEGWGFDWLTVDYVRRRW